MSFGTSSSLDQRGRSFIQSFCHIYLISGKCRWYAKWHQIVIRSYTSRKIFYFSSVCAAQSQFVIYLFLYFSGLLIRMSMSPVFLGLRVQIRLEALPGQQSCHVVPVSGRSHVRYLCSWMHASVCESQRNTTCVSSCVSLRCSQWPEVVCGSCK